MRKRFRWRDYPRTFWAANTIELFERWAWYGMFMLLGLYLTGSTAEGALGFSQEQKGYMMGPVVAILYFLPVITGAIADRYGYKKILLISFGITTSAYFLMGVLSSYSGMFLAFLWLALGAALFKPVVSATIAKTTNEKNSSIGFGIFYMMVNLGALIGPIFGSKLRELDWFYVFLMSAGIAALNFFLVLFLYKEPAREKSTEPLGKSIIRILKNIGKVLLDFRFSLFLILMVGFWSMYNQLFYTLPIYIDQWVDTRPLYDVLNSTMPWLANFLSNGKDYINPEMITNMDAMFIVIFQIMISAIVMRFKPLHAMVAGIFIAAVGIGLSFATNNVLYIIPSLLVFAVGEMASSPKSTEYIGRIAPEGKTALYMGASFLPMAGGNLFAGILSGSVYGKMSDKLSLLKTEVAERGINLPEITDGYDQTQYMQDAASAMGMDMSQLTAFLWDKYHPDQFWIVVFSIGLGTALLLWLYDIMINKK